MKRILMATAATLLAACSDTTGPGGSNNEQLAPGLTLSIGVRGAAPAGLAGFSASMSADTFNIGGDQLVIDRVQLVVRELELERVFAPGCNDDDDCEEFETGPILVDLPLGGVLEQVLTVAVDTGTYDEIEFEIHKPEDDDAAFVQQHPDFAGISVRVDGSFNGTPFTYTTSLSVEQEIELATPLVITDASQAVNLTLMVDVSGWFVSNGALLDPSAAGDNEGIIKENIKNSFEAFGDDDRDGDDDHDDDGADDNDDDDGTDDQGTGDN